jgi:Protein of unknown function, DUF547
MGIGTKKLVVLAATTLIAGAWTAEGPLIADPTSSLTSTTSMWTERSVVPEPFRGVTPGSSHKINYDDLSYLWKNTVLVTGRSDRVNAGRPVPSPGTRVVRAARGHTANEGNRLDFPTLKQPETFAQLVRIRRSLEAIPGQLPMVYLNKNEQIAYWLNLYNVAIVEQLISVYPESTLKKVFTARTDNLWDEKFLTVSGVPLSLNDIQFRILIPKFKNPAVIYGLFQGFIGGPNIRNEAYTGDRVMEQLKRNGEEFINSNRGTNRQVTGAMRVSQLYRVNGALFPSFNNDLRRHLRQYADPDYRAKIDNAARFNPKITNWHIADLFNGHRGLATSSNTNGAALLGAMGVQDRGLEMMMSEMTVKTGRFPMHTLAFVRTIQERLVKTRKGQIKIEEVDE